MTDDAIDRFELNDWEEELKTIQDVEIVLLFGREFEVEYQGYVGLLTTSFGAGFSVFAHKREEPENKFEYDTDNLDEFAQHATFGPYLVRDIVGKWNITWHA